MCYDDDAQPPVPTAPITGTSASGIRLTSADGTVFAAYEARPDDVRGPGVVILPDLRGLHDFYKQLAVRLAEQGHPAIAIDYYGRTATDDDRGEDFPFMEHVSKLGRESIQDDIMAAADRLGRPAVARPARLLRRHRRRARGGLRRRLAAGARLPQRQVVLSDK
ncbi:dienelactone hydrolase family protein [Nonomuraea sp. NPDC049028]|uniref:dienelactone hydrolase family protein n=1 Tax=Nonomuraea sp. NPDC049028 TaxID=3364348 RepID=UPI003716432D